jgi:hypothetical protein
VTYVAVLTLFLHGQHFTTMYYGDVCDCYTAAKYIVGKLPAATVTCDLRAAGFMEKAG